MEYSFFAQLYGYGFNGDGPTTWSFILLYATVSLLCALVYKLGFAKKLPILKSVIVYVVLFLGCIPFTIFFALFLPVVSCLIVLAIVFGGYRFRLYRSRKLSEGQQE